MSAVTGTAGVGSAGPDPRAASLAPPAGDPVRRARRARRWPRPVAAALVALAVMGGGYGVAALRDGGRVAPALGPGEVTVQVAIDHSLFHTGPLRVVTGTRVRFVVVNRDPIGHEFIVGPPEVHARHAAGHEARHPSTPGEVSVDAGATAVTTYRFTTPGRVEYACHLPRHYEYGMHGMIEVVPAR